ncbi:MAG: dethiobiotin synthase [Planctomycetes bacterium]|nr:dethiobiotin synthase [Planctomycetota bacterium]
MNLRDCHFQKAKGLFITGTDTGVGKTLICGGIAQILLKQRLKVGVFKPVATGCVFEMGEWVSEDAKFLKMCAELEEPLSVITPVCYEIPAAPLVCVRAEKRPIDFEQISAMYNYLAKACDVVLVEGIGGALVPLDEQTMIVDLAAKMKLPTVIVAREKLGTINHTLLTIQAVRNAGLHVAGVVINGHIYPTLGIAEETSPKIIAELGDTKILATVGRDDQSSVEDLRLGQMIIAGLVECDWKSLILAV